MVSRERHTIEMGGILSDSGLRRDYVELDFVEIDADFDKALERAESKGGITDIGGRRAFGVGTGLESAVVFAGDHDYSQGVKVEEFAKAVAGFLAMVEGQLLGVRERGLLVGGRLGDSSVKPLALALPAQKLGISLPEGYLVPIHLGAYTSVEAGEQGAERRNAMMNLIKENRPLLLLLSLKG